MRKLRKSKCDTLQPKKRKGMVKRRRSVPVERLLSTEGSGKPGLRYLHIGRKFGVWIVTNEKKRFKALVRE